MRSNKQRCAVTRRSYSFISVGKKHVARGFGEILSDGQVALAETSRRAGYQVFTGMNIIAGCLFRWLQYAVQSVDPSSIQFLFIKRITDSDVSM